MPLIYVTGISTSGKSAVLEELRSRGFAAYGVDEHGYGKWLNRRSGEQEELTQGMSEPDVHIWIAEHEWVLDIEKIAELKGQSDLADTVVFLCGVAAGDAEAWRYFDLVCALVVDEATIRERVVRRTNFFGKRPDQLAQILEWNAGNEAAYRRFGATIIDARRPLVAVVDDILAAAEG